CGSAAARSPGPPSPASCCADGCQDAAVTDDLLGRLEAYYDNVPRRFARTEECGPFTLFLGEPGGWTYYARPRLGGGGPFTPDDGVAAVARLVELGLPQSVEWVHETTPALLDVVEATGRFDL